MSNKFPGKVLVIIPAYQEEGSIQKVIDRIHSALPEADIVVVNDGSTDRTGELARAKGVAVIELPFNLGIGGAMQTGYRYASQRGYDVAVQIDADGQHNPDDLETLLHTLQRTGADMVIGSRFLEDRGYRPSMARWMGIKLFSALVSFVIRQPVKDTTSGYRAVGRRVINLFAREYPTDYPEVEVLVLLKRNNLRIMEVPVTMSSREAGKSSITPLRSFYYIVKVVLAILIQASRTEKQVSLDG